MIERDRAYLAYLERHRQYVLEECLQLDIRDRGLQHDLSKFSVQEWVPYAEYFYGGYPRGEIPAEVQRAFDLAWLHHQRHNDHHWQYWVLREDSGMAKVLPMSEEALREMVADWRGAGRAILGVEADAAAWYRKQAERMLLHPDTRLRVEQLLGMQGRA